MSNPRFPASPEIQDILDKAENPTHDGTDAWPACSCDNCAAWRRSPANQIKSAPLSKAQQALESRDAYEFAVMYAAYKGQPSPMLKVFHFEDGSYLSFNVSYTPAEAGRTFPCALPNGI